MKFVEAFDLVARMELMILLIILTARRMVEDTSHEGKIHIFGQGVRRGNLWNQPRKLIKKEGKHKVLKLHNVLYGLRTNTKVGIRRVPPR